MDPLVFGLLLFGATVIAIVWAGVFVASLAFRALRWVLCIPAHAARSAGAIGRPPALAAARAAAPVASAAYTCVNEKCQTALPPAARFCPRCGAHVAASGARRASGQISVQARVA